MEMTWWHLAHYALWDRWECADKALGCYRRFTPAARQLAAQLGYKGLKWQKSVGPEGRSAPWGRQPGAALEAAAPDILRRVGIPAASTRATLDKWADIVEGTAEHMADYPRPGTTRPASVTSARSCRRASRASPAIPYSTLPTGRWGLDTAQQWRERRGLARQPHWGEVRHNLAALPVVNGCFVHSSEWTDTYTSRAWEHPDPVGVLGMLPSIDGVDGRIARHTVARVWKTWDWNRVWGWDFPWTAMAAARTGQPQIAVEALLKDSSRNESL